MSQSSQASVSRDASPVRTAGMDRLLAAGDDPLDVLVIGGGILGAFVAWDVTRRGYRCALVEREDFGGATTAGCGRVLHGGIRHLRSLEIRAAAESRSEQRRLHDLAPGLVRALPFVVPTGAGPKGWGVARAGALAWDGFRRLHTAADAFPASRVARLAWPDVLAESWGLCFTDLQIRSPERLTLALVLAAIDAGAVAANYVRAEAVRADGMGAIVSLVDGLSGDVGEVRARVIVNAGGAWAGDVAGATPALPPIAWARGIHVVVDRGEPEHAIGLPWNRDRLMFFMPWEGRTLIGATYRPGEPARRGPEPEPGEIDGLVADLASRYPDLAVDRDDVVHAWAGFYPIFHRSRVDETRYDVSMKPLFTERPLAGGGLVVTAVAVKLTTARRLAARVGDRVEACLGRGQAAPPGPDAPLQRAREPWTDPPLDADALRRAARESAEREMAVRLEDFVMRRTTLGQRNRLGRPHLDAAARGMAEVLGWDPGRTRSEMAHAEGVSARRAGGTEEAFE